MDERRVVIIGAGPAGVATAVSLRDRGVASVLVDRAGLVAASWRARYDRLKLNTGKQFSHLPGRPYPVETPTFPTRDDVADYFNEHARADGIQLRLNTLVERIDPGLDGWRVLTTSGYIEAEHVVVATGFDHTPHVPDWPGLHTFTGDVLHSSAYRNTTPYVGKAILVVGAGSSGMEIAHDLTQGGAAKVWLAVRTPPNILLRNGPGGLSGDVIAKPLFHAPPRLADAFARFARRRAIGDLTEFGLPIPDEGPFTLTRRNISPTVVDMDVIESIKNRTIEVVPTVESAYDNGVSLVDGRLLSPDVLICATGYRRGLQPLVGHLGVLNEQGLPWTSAPAAAADGLWFIGFFSRPSAIGQMGKQSKKLARSIARVTSTGLVSYDLAGSQAWT